MRRQSVLGRSHCLLGLIGIVDSDHDIGKAEAGAPGTIGMAGKCSQPLMGERVGLIGTTRRRA